MKLAEIIKSDEPCGGAGKCGKCRVRVSGELSGPNAVEKRILGGLLDDGWRLACQAEVVGKFRLLDVTDRKLKLTQNVTDQNICENQKKRNVTDSSLSGLAVDIGTTTIEVRYFEDGKICDRSALNPQRRFGADVISRLGASEHMDELISELRSAVSQLTEGFSYDRAVVCGNTAMLHFLTGSDVSGMICDPFTPSTLFGFWIDGGSVGLRGRVYLPRCVSAFIGADTTAAMLAAGLRGSESDDGTLLVDLGTNGELVYSSGGELICASTAAGPALEGADISCGTRACEGAIDRVNFDGNRVIAHTIGGKKAVGICGSGLISAVNALVSAGIIDESGYLEKPFELADGIFLEPRDVRAFQLAKSAIATGIGIITDGEKPKKLLVAGNFGRGLDIPACVRLGLLPECGEVEVIGNAALRGAELILKGASEPKNAVCRELAADGRFDEMFCENLMLRKIPEL